MTKTPLILETGRQVRVLALDTSTKTGWALCDIDGSRPVYGTWDLGTWRRETVEQAFGALMVHVAERIETGRVSHLVIEKPLNVYAHSGFQGARARKDPDLAAALLGFWACATGAAACKGVQVFETDPATVRKHFIANGRHPDPKAAVMARCRQLGWKPQNDNEGDALSIWDYAKSVLDPGWAGRAPFALFQQGRKS